MLLTLLIITFVSSAVVGFVYSLTEKPIGEVKKKKIKASIEQVIPAFDTVTTFKVADDGDSLVFYSATKNGAAVGTAIETFDNNGFSGHISIMVGFLPDGTINGVAVLSQNETPGLGAKMSEKQKEGAKPAFTTQFLGKNPINFKLAVTKDGGNVDAITASTISSRAFCLAVQRAYDALKAHQAADMDYSQLVNAE